jgi:NAD(P)-dependent dehydrogenase (short-subunit alcohol dehydrogenase family)
MARRDAAWLKPWRPEGEFMAVKTWFITGTSRGFGREWAIAALDRGDMVAASARDIASLDDLAAPLGIATADYESRLAAWRAWQPVAAAQGDGN